MLELALPLKMDHCQQHVFCNAILINCLIVDLQLGVFGFSPLGGVALCRTRTHPMGSCPPATARLRSTVGSRSACP